MAILCNFAAVFVIKFQIYEKNHFIYSRDGYISHPPC